MADLWLWGLLTLLVVFATVGLVLPLAARRGAPQRPSPAVDQASVLTALAVELADLDRQQAEGVLDPGEAAVLKAGVRRRLEEEARRLAAGSAPAASRLGEGALRWLAWGLAGTVTVGSVLLYGWMGRPDLARQGEAAAGPEVRASTQPGPTSGAGEEVGRLVRQLESRLAANPGDAEGWRMLGWSRFELGDYAGSADAYRRAVELEPANADYLSALGEAQVMAAGGEIRPEARAVFTRAIAANPGDARARYYLAAARDQAGDTRGAIDDWLKLLADAPEAPWTVPLRNIILERAAAAGIDVSGRLPAPPGASARPPGAPPGVMPAPTPDQLAEANALSPADRQAMIRGMVDGLEARLGENPRDLEGWQRLIRARLVLGETDRARAAYARAQQAFAGNPAAQADLRALARQLNLPGA